MGFLESVIGIIAVGIVILYAHGSFSHDNSFDNVKDVQNDISSNLNQIGNTGNTTTSLFGFEVPILGGIFNGIFSLFNALGAIIYMLLLYIGLITNIPSLFPSAFAPIWIILILALSMGVYRFAWGNK